MSGLKNKLLATLVALLSGLPALAGRLDTLAVRRSFWDNWSVQGTLGIQTLVQPRHEFRGRIMPGADITVGKAFSPYGGARLGYQRGFLSMWGTSPKYSWAAEEDTFRGQSMYKENLNFEYLHGDVFLDVTNLIGGVNASRRISVAPYMHFGYLGVYAGKQRVEREFASGPGLLTQWRLTDHLSAALDLRAMLFSGVVSPDKKVSDLLGLSAQTGLVWVPGRMGWKQYRTLTPYKTGFLNNFFVSVMGGANTIGILRDFHGAGAPALDLTVGRWFSPYFGMRLGWQGLEFVGRGSSPLPEVDAQPDGDLYRERFRFGYLHGDILWDWLPDRPESRWRLGYYVHMGVISESGINGGDVFGRFFTAGPGLFTQFQLLPRLWLQMDLRGFVMNGGRGGDTASGMVVAGSALGGLAVDIGRQDWHRWTPNFLRERKPGLPYSQGRFRDNWSLRAAIGATGSSLALDLSLTKWLSPPIALRGGYQGLSLSDGTATVGFAYFHGDVLVNMVDLLAGYVPERRWRVMPLLHFGVVSEYDPVTLKGRGLDFATGAGLMGAWQLTKHLSLSAEYRWTVFPATSAPITSGDLRSVSTFLGGVEYHFGGRGWKPLDKAQADGVRVSHFLDNWFVSAGMGVNGITSLRKWNSLPDWGADVTVGKWFSPRFGVRGGWQGLRLSQSGTSPRTGTAVKQANGLYRETLGFAYFHGDFLWNFTNTVAPYRQDRVWTVQPYMHMGLMLQYNVDKWPRKLSRRELVAGAGLINAFQLEPSTDLFLDLRVSALRSNASPDTQSGISLAPSAIIGITRRLGAVGFDEVPDSGYRDARERGRWSVSLNLLDVAQLGTIGGSVQYATSRHVTVEVTPRVNAWSFKEEELYNERQALAIGARWWPWYVYSGFFVKGSAQVEAVRRKGVSQLSEGAGESYGAGLAVGYSWMLTRWLNLDLAAGVWGGRKREPGSLERSWFIAPDALTAGVMFVF